jgi:hypothetical protein
VIGSSAPGASKTIVDGPRPSAESKHQNAPEKPPAPAAAPPKQPNAPVSSAVHQEIAGPPILDNTSPSRSEHPTPDLPWVMPFPPTSETDSAAAAKPSAAKKLEIAEFRLCRNISGFGAFEVFPENAFKPGQQLMIYCEMIGLQYERTDNSFLSKMSSRLELVADDHGKVAWEQNLGTAQDSCRRIRRDYYVNYWVELPAALARGHYRLRLIQTDQIGNHTTSAEIPLDIGP